ncbi:MCE family protein [Planomonospora venezuelensis]|uniref:Phospholipid/cholesterol/gamma-HCH transport system substrate-binding protein n=1 Tax=Planomonospora venezuelensis TaxID=1999 RepID=A0A841D987_PLAVE|nr:MlaD family protein [Planomonospora venezuelensis]MBB5964695.1 phospholipid/cholesterol/gamma-HCH transport system substrate-binding protein [Planomonospora venezuelensis]GIN03102.1 ABC transporter substrate-binding protein [Planomonospora venezuelensis]
MAGSREQIQRRWTLGKFALFLAVTVTLIVLIGAQIARVGVGDTYSLVGTFDDVAGLHVGDQVKIAGAPVGQVDSIEVVNGRAEVTMSVQTSVRVPSDSSAAVRWRNTIGQRVVYLEPGTAKDMLGDGARVRRTSSVVDIGALVSDLGPLTRSLDPEQINQLLTAAGQALDGNQKNIPKLVENLDDLTTTVAERKKIIQGLLEDYATVTGVVARRDEQISRLVDNLVTLTDAFARNRKLIDEALVELSTTVRVNDRVLGENSREFGRVVDSMTRLTGGVRRNISSIERVLATLTPPLQRSFQVTGRGHFVTTAVPCLALGPLPCPYPMNSPPPLRGGLKLTSTGNLRRVLVGP